MTTRPLTFKRIQDTTADDWAIIATRHNTKLFEELPDRLLGALRFLENGDFYTVNGLEHSLQAGTRALRHGRPAEYVVAALLHDVGDLVGPGTMPRSRHRSSARTCRRGSPGSSSTTRCSSSTISDATSASTPTCATPTLAIPTTKTRPSCRPLRLGELRSVVPIVATEEFEPLLRQVFVSSERSPFELVNSHL